eukprot:675960-Rhodomonas_salina.1
MSRDGGFRGVVQGRGAFKETGNPLNGTFSTVTVTLYHLIVELFTVDLETTTFDGTGRMPKTEATGVGRARQGKWRYAAYPGMHTRYPRTNAYPVCIRVAALLQVLLQGKQGPGPVPRVLLC